MLCQKVKIVKQLKVEQVSKLIFMLNIKFYLVNILLEKQSRNVLGRDWVKTEIKRFDAIKSNGLIQKQAVEKNSLLLNMKNLC